MFSVILITKDEYSDLILILQTKNVNKAKTNNYFMSAICEIPNNKCRQNIICLRHSHFIKKVMCLFKHVQIDSTQTTLHIER